MGCCLFMVLGAFETGAYSLPAFGNQLSHCIKNQAGNLPTAFEELLLLRLFSAKSYAIWCPFP